MERRGRVRRVMHAPWFEGVLVVLIVVSSILAVVEVNGGLSSGPALLVRIAGDAISGIFLGELAVRCWTYRLRSRFFGRYWLDILASLPFPSGFEALRILRLLRVLRLLRLGTLLRRRFTGGSGGDFALLLVTTLIVVLLGASISALFEHKLNREHDSLGYSFWWSVFSMIAGEPMDGVPRTLTGRLISLVLAMSGLCVFAVVTGAAAALMTQRLRRLEVHSMDMEELEDHIVICGWDRRAPLVIEELQHSTEEKERAIVIVAELEELPPLNWKIVNRDRVYLLNGDFTKAETLERAGIRRASKAIIMSDKTGNRSDQDRDARTILAALTIEKLNHGIYTCAELLNREHEAHLRMAGVEDVACVSEYGATMMSSMAIHSGISSIIGELLSVQYGNEFFKVDLPASLEGKSFREAMERLIPRNAITIAVERPMGGKRREMALNPEPAFLLQRGDRLVVIARARPDLTGI